MDSIIVVNDQEAVLVSNDTAQTIVTGLMGPPGKDGIQSLAQANDVDTSELTHGSTLIYNSNEAKWKATTKLESQILEAGQF